MIERVFRPCRDLTGSRLNLQPSAKALGYFRKAAVRRAPPIARGAADPPLVTRHSSLVTRHFPFPNHSSLLLEFDRRFFPE